MKTKTCLRYPGGKFYGSKLILPKLQIDHKEYREPFLGGASIFLSLPSIAPTCWLNDRDAELMNFYKVIAEDKSREELFELLDGEIVNKERYQEVRSMKPSNEIERAFKYFYLNRTSFSGIMVKPRWGYLIGSSLTPENWIGRIIPVAEKLSKVRLTNSDFREVLNSADEGVLSYIDPPYFVASRGIYSCEFSTEDHEELAEILRATKSKFVLSYENSEPVRKMYRWANIEESTWVYYMSEDRRQQGKELIITNF